jgi:hypothetical protein
MTSGSICEVVGSLRSVGGFHDVWAYSGVFRELSQLPGTPWQLGERCSGQFSGRLVSDVFTCRRCLLTWDDQVDGLPYPLHQPMAHCCTERGRAFL